MFKSQMHWGKDQNYPDQKANEGRQRWIDEQSFELLVVNWVVVLFYATWFH